MNTNNFENLDKQGVYSIKNRITNNYYIGSTTMSFLKRFHHHLSLLRKNNHKNQYLQNAWNKYGEENFDFSILEEIELSEQFQKEQEWINKLNPFGKNGYNIERLTYEGANCPYVIIKNCTDCGSEFQTYKDSAIRCGKCRDKEVDGYFEERDNYIDNLKNTKAGELITYSGYDNMDDFWECNGI